jgi:hypothetical protein
MLSLGVESNKIRLLSVALGHLSGVLRLRLVVIHLSIDLHQGCLLFSTNHEFLSICSCFINICDGFCSHLSLCDFLLTRSIGEQDGCSFFSIFLLNLLLGVGCNFLLFFVGLGPGNGLLKLVELSLVFSFEISKLLLFLVIESQLLVLLLLRMVLQFDPEPRFLLQGADKLRVDNDVGDVALLE